MHQVTPLQAQVETMLRDGFPEVEVLLVDKPSPNRVRVYIDRETSPVDTDLLEQVSRELSPLREQWALEVSSPGIERPLVKPDHYKRVVGSPVAGRDHPQRRVRRYRLHPLAHHHGPERPAEPHLPQRRNGRLQRLNQRHRHWNQPELQHRRDGQPHRRRDGEHRDEPGF